jgi:hypothetical protein
MPIPPRFELTPPSEELVQEMCRLCSAIERDLERHGDAKDLLEEWHRHATRPCDPHEFTSYWKSTDQEEFVREAVYPRPVFVADLTFGEARAVLEAVARVELEEAETVYFLKWLEAQFPKANISDLIYWPDEWFGDASLFRDSGGAFKPEAELSLDQILGYAMKRSSRELPGSPADIILPYPVPPRRWPRGPRRRRGRSPTPSRPSSRGRRRRRPPRGPARPRR